MSDYKAEHIQVLEGIEAVRKRPGMYIGSTGADGLQHLVFEIVGNAVDEAIAGYAKNINVKLLKGGKIFVSDDGRGIPVDIHLKTKKTALETVLTLLHAGGKFSHKVYKVAGGLHGVGLSVVNALSKKLRAVVYRDGFEWTQEYERGIPQTKVEQGKKSSKTGTTIIFEPDQQIFTEKIDYDRNKILDYLRHQAFLTPGLRINFYDEREDSVFGYGFYFETGLNNFFKHITINKKLISAPIYFSHKEEKGEIEIIFGYTVNQENTELAFVNNIQNPEGGTHLNGFKSGLLKIFNDFGKSANIIKEKSSLIADDLKSGFVGIISLKIAEPQFEGQTKAKLGNPEVRYFVESNLTNFLKEYFGKNPNEVKALLQRVLLNFEVRKATKSAKEAVFKKRLSPTLTLSGKLADCSNRDVSKRELFIVEGDSAGGSMKSGRDRSTQAVLPLRGKILNVEKATLDKILKSEEIKNLIIAMGSGVGKDFNLENLRYSKIIIATDSDIDGSHIRTLLLTLFHRYFKTMIEQDFLYAATPPLYKITEGKKVDYAFSDIERNKILKKTTKTTDVQRYKGLGEMNPEELWETTLNPENRVLKRITIENSEEASRLFNVLMGAEVEPRRRFIETYAKEVKNLDI
ncbi:MAG: DNA gyrase subunit B [Patescibacteria group bacterium]|mgnify:FL=1